MYSLDDIINPKKEYLSDDPATYELLPYLSGRMKTKRLRKKFMQNVSYYAARDGFIIPDVRAEWKRKRWQGLGKVMADAIYSRLSEESFCATIFRIESLQK